MAQTDSERYLARLCRHSFLRLWSWPSLFRDQRISGNSEGKEICDLLVVFDQHLFIFSDKYCAFPDTGNVGLDWSRWFKRAIKKSAEQVWGAERWLRDYPDRVFVDRACTQRLPIGLPPLSNRIVHRIVVAHGSGERCRTSLGGTGSLMIRPSVIGKAHYDPSLPNFAPFAVGVIDQREGFIHVVDDFSLDVLLKTLDTAADLATYLEKKEALIRRGQLISAAGEEDLLAYYVSRLNKDGEHDFIVPDGCNQIGIDEGHWRVHTTHPDRLSQVRANTVSYAWDRLIEKFTHHAVAGTQYTCSHPSIVEQEGVFRFLAREHRTRRRMLAKSLIGIMKQGDSNHIAARVMLPSAPADPHYVFLSVQMEADRSYEEYRAFRRGLLEAYCMATKLKWPEAHHVVGIATEPHAGDGSRSEDLLLLDSALWDAAAEADARRVVADLGLLTRTTSWHTTEDEYPRLRDRELAKGRNRNLPCACGSGKKYKKCCASLGGHLKTGH